MTFADHPSIAELLVDLFQSDESERIEAKTATEIGKSIIETVIAFANEPNLNGGYLLLGVTPDDKSSERYQIVGVNDPDKLRNDLSSQCRTGLNASIHLRTWTEMIDDKMILAVYVAEADPTLKPIYRTAVGLPKGAFRRSPSGDYRCTDQDIADLFRQKTANEYDSTIPPDAELKDIDPEAIAIYRAERVKAKPNAEELNWSDKELLNALGCTRKARGIFKPTVAGVLLFGKQSALRRILPSVRVDYIRVPGKEWIEDPRQRYDTIEMRDCIFRLIRRSIAAVLDDLPTSFNLPKGQLTRRDQPVLPTEIVREAIVNALMHRNYQKHQPVQIIRYANRLEIRNPGYSLKPLEQLGEPGSVTRNPKIASVLHDTNLAETKGSGIRVMRTLMEEAGLELPQFDSDRHGDQFQATYLFHHFLTAQDVEWLGKFKNMDLDDTQRKALIFARETGSITNSAFRTMNKVDPQTASQKLCRMRDMGVLESQGKGRGTTYILSEAFSSRARQFALDLFADSDAKTASPSLATHDTPWMESPMSGPKSPMVRTKSPMPGQQQPMAETTSQKPSEEEIPQQRLKTDDLREAILQACQDGPKTGKELGARVGRSYHYLKQRYLIPMVHEGALAYLFPSKPKSPKQAYLLPNVETERSQK